MDGNVIYILDRETNNTEDVANVATRSTSMVACSRYGQTHSNFDALQKRQRNMLIRKCIRNLMGSCITRDTHLHVPASPPPPPPPPPPRRSGGGLPRFIPYPRPQRRRLCLDSIDDQSRMTQDLLSRLNPNLSGLAPKPKSSELAINLDLKL